MLSEGRAEPSGRAPTPLRKVYDDCGDVDEEGAAPSMGEHVSWCGAGAVVVGDACRDAYFRAMYVRVDADLLRAFAQSYQGSDEERNDVKAAYLQHQVLLHAIVVIFIHTCQGDMGAIIDSVMCCTVAADEARFRSILQQCIGLARPTQSAVDGLQMRASCRRSLHLHPSPAPSEQRGGRGRTERRARPSSCSRRSRTRREPRVCLTTPVCIVPSHRSSQGCERGRWGRVGDIDQAAPGRPQVGDGLVDRAPGGQVLPRCIGTRRGTGR